jgi:hypothetical protein
MMMRRLLDYLGIGWLLGLYGVTLGTFLLAYWNASKTVLVRINAFGEADAELAMFAIITPIIGYSVWRFYHDDSKGVHVSEADIRLSQALRPGPWVDNSVDGFPGKEEDNGG